MHRNDRMKRFNPPERVNPHESCQTEKIQTSTMKKLHRLIKSRSRYIGLNNICNIDPVSNKSSIQHAGIIVENNNSPNSVNFEKEEKEEEYHHPTESNER